MDYPQFKSSKTQNFFQENRLIFADNPENGGGGGEDPPEKMLLQEGVDTAEDMRGVIRGAVSEGEVKPRKGGQYPMGKVFSLQEEKGRLSEKAIDFLAEWSQAVEVLKDLYEYDAYSYIHTVQMLNEACILVDEKFSELQSLVTPQEKTEVNSRFDIPSEKLRDVLIGSIVFHDWGKRDIDSDVLNYPGKLLGERKEEMERHPMETLKAMMPSLIGREIGEKSNNEEIKMKLSEILDADGFSRNKMQLIMAYISVSHHCYKKNRDNDKEYPKLEDIEKVLPGYTEWLNSGGEELATVTALFDVNDALRSERSYKVPMKDEKKIRDILALETLTDEIEPRYQTLIQWLADNWYIMPGSDKYTRDRKTRGEGGKSKKD
jgi:HD-GYP domain-containing protein (c-di-GMP phosphodiesterase class II)